MRTFLLIVLLALAAVSVGAECRAVIIAGDPGVEPAWAANFSRWSGAWATLLERDCHVPAGNVRLLSSPAPTELAVVAADTLATRDNSLRALEGLAKACAPGDQAIVVLIGHGYQSEGVAKLCLAGADLADVDVVRALATLRARSCAVLVLAPEGAAWAKALVAPGRVLVVANLKQSAPYFGEFLLRTLHPETTLLDAVNSASAATIAWYQNQFEVSKVVTVHGKDNQDIYRLLYPGRKFKPGDEKPRAAINDPARSAAFSGRRVLAEIAGIEDDGDGEPSTVFEEGIEPKPISGDKDGKLARALVLGRP
jgi:hypothetical protein